jgi:hypothetical protein
MNVERADRVVAEFCTSLLHFMLSYVLHVLTSLWIALKCIVKAIRYIIYGFMPFRKLKP